LVVWRNAGSPKSCATTTSWMEKMEIIHFRPIPTYCRPFPTHLPTYYRPISDLLPTYFLRPIPTMYRPTSPIYLPTYLWPISDQLTDILPSTDLFPTYYRPTSQDTKPEL
jgi:hypothetical protein